jgi:tetratricopeptide (TPR) repeat protein
MLALPALAHAQNAEAEALFGDAEKLMSAGKLDEACDAFEASNRIEPRAGTLIRLGECREKNKELASAWSAYRDALTRVKDPHKRQVASAAAAALEERLSFLTISVSDEARVEGLVITRNAEPIDRALWNRAVPVDGGAYVIGGRAPGHEEWTTTVVVPVRDGRVSLDVPKFKALETLVTDPRRGPSDDPDDADDDDDDADDDDDEDDESPAGAPGTFTGRRKVALGVGGAGVLALALGGVLGSQAAGLERDAFDLCPDRETPCTDATEAEALLDRARSRALFANVSYGVGAAAIAGAVILWFTGAPSAQPDERPRRASLTPHLAPGHASLELAVVF